MFLLGGLRFARRQEFTAGMCTTPSAWTKQAGWKGAHAARQETFLPNMTFRNNIAFSKVHLKGVFQRDSEGQHKQAILLPFTLILWDRKVLAAPALEAARTSKATEDSHFSTCLFVCSSFAPHWLCSCQSDSSRF